MPSIYLVIRTSGEPYEGYDTVPLLAFTDRRAAEAHASKCDAAWRKVEARLTAWRDAATEIFNEWWPLHNQIKMMSTPPPADLAEREAAAWTREQAWEKKKPKLRTRFDPHAPEDTQGYSVLVVRLKK